MIDDSERHMDVVVEDDQLALAIGRRGQNVRLAAMLTGYNINIISKTKLQERFKAAADNLLQLEGVTDPYAQMLVQAGVMNVGDFISLEVSDIAQVLNVEESFGK